MSTKLLKTGFHNLCKVAALVLLGNADSFFDLSFFQATGNSGREFARLFACLTEGNVTVNHDADGPGGHDCEKDDDSLGGNAHVCPHGTQVKTDLIAL